jgi:hypothetical protein
MSQLRIAMAADREAFVPGERVCGELSWELHPPPRVLELSLRWRMQGKGAVDQQVLETISIVDPPPNGRLLSLQWELHAMARPSGVEAQRGIVVSPSRRPIELGTQDEQAGAV